MQKISSAFVLIMFNKKVIDQSKRELIDRLLLERIFLAVITRAAQVSK